jgi:hypothetical protein
MQLHLEIDELQLLANVLLEDPRDYNEMLDKVLARDLRFDASDLEEIADLLAAKSRRMKDEINCQSQAAPKLELQRQLALLERALDKVTEACAML